jgi:hypothetical protein
MPLRSKTVLVFLIALNGPSAFMTFLRLDASFMMMPRILRPDTSQRTGRATGLVRHHKLIWLTFISHFSLTFLILVFFS